MSILTDHAQPRHISAGKMLAYALVEDTPQGWHDLSALLALRLSPEERMCIAGAAMVTLDREDREAIFAALKMELRPE